MGLLGFPAHRRRARGAETPPTIDGISVVPTLLGRKQPQHKYLYWESPGNRFGQAVRMGDWKALRRSLEGPVELYNLVEDVGEKNDVAARNLQVVAKAQEFFQTARTEAVEYPLRLSKR